MGRFISRVPAIQSVLISLAPTISDSLGVPEQPLLLRGISQFKNCLCTKRKGKKK